ncbi:hypothetical protein [Priestia megaterium]|uniref:hypothetical protein n=1 Tax=Priestia megaterium TaxID=1404 RepID=UPI002FFF629D
MRVIHHILNKYIFDVKSMGSIFIVPLLIITIYTLIIGLVPLGFLRGEVVFLSFQILIVPISSWWITYFLFEVYQQNAEEILVNYYKRFLLQEMLRFFLLFIVAVLPIWSIISLKYTTIFSWEILLLHICQIVFFMALSMFITIFLKSTEASLAFISLYCSVEAITSGQLIPWFHIFYLNTLSITFEESLYLSIKNIILALIFLALSSLYFKKTERNII